MRTRSGKPIAAHMAVVQGRTSKLWMDVGDGDLNEHVRSSLESCGWTNDKIIRIHITVDPDTDESWAYWTCAIMVRDE